MSDRLYEAAKSALAAIGLLCVLTFAAGGVIIAEPNAGWTTFWSGALWFGVPLAIGINRYRQVPA